jgi:alcohol dehydrogenase (NADP+)
MKILSYAAQNATAPLTPFKLERRDPGEEDVQIQVLYCGVCHSDLHTVRNEWQGTIYPCVPGHEIIGRVTKVGANVKKFKDNDIVGVGCLVDSCHTCENCKDELEQFCQQGPIFTYNSPDKHTGGLTYGGYSNSIVVDEAFVLQIPKNLDLAATAPLLCAGITTYSPLRHNHVTKGQKVGIVGLGGLGHMGVKLAKAFGAHVVVFTTSPNKVKDALRLGADEVVNSKNEDEMKKHLNSFHFILDTVAAQHDINAYLALLKRDGTLTQVGVPPEPLSVQVGSLIFGRRNFSGSLIGGIKETQEMLDFCGKHNITSDIELIPIQKINEAYDRLVKSDVKYRFVIDMASLKEVV